jgi:hypothetical protein
MVSIFTSATLTGSKSARARSSKTKNVLFAAIAIVGALICLEVFASWALMLRMRLAKTENFTKSEPTYFSLLNIPYRAGVKFGFFGDQTFGPFEYRFATVPHPQHEPDPELGSLINTLGIADSWTASTRAEERESVGAGCRYFGEAGKHSLPLCGSRRSVECARKRYDIASRYL